MSTKRWDGSNVHPLADMSTLLRPWHYNFTLVSMATDGDGLCCSIKLEENLTGAKQGTAAVRSVAWVHSACFHLWVCVCVTTGALRERLTWICALDFRLTWNQTVRRCHKVCISFISAAASASALPTPNCSEVHWMVKDHKNGFSLGFPA